MKVRLKRRKRIVVTILCSQCGRQFDVNERDYLYRTRSRPNAWRCCSPRCERMFRRREVESGKEVFTIEGT